MNKILSNQRIKTIITQEIFDYFKKIKAMTDQHIPHELFLPIRNKISFAAATNYSLEDTDGKRFWDYIDTLTDQGLINSVHYVMTDLWTVSDTNENDDELFRSSEDAYLMYILFKTPLSIQLTEEGIVKDLNEKFSAECFMHRSFGEGVWGITWD